MAHYGTLPFAEALAFLKAKLNLPTERWDDLLGAAHDRAFVVAGAMQADLLADLHTAVNKAREQGIPFSVFQKDFERIVAERGWTGWTGEGSKGGRAWRARVLYETNLQTSYAAGRYQQMKAITAKRPYWRYRHNDAVVHARPEHQAWDGKVLRHDDPWWAGRYPPNGFGCRCFVETLSERDVERLGLTPTTGHAMPYNGTVKVLDQRSGQTLTLPQGVDKGWDYNPGASQLEHLKKLLAQKEQKLNEFDFLEGGPRRGERPKHLKPTTLGTLSTEQLSKLEGDAKAYVLKNGQKTGYEHMAVIDLRTGKPLAQGTSNDPGRVYLPDEVTRLADDPTQKIAYHHNHPDSYSLSPGDLTIMGKRPGVFQVIVYGHDGSWFRAERRDFREFAMALDAAKHEIWQQTGLARRRGLFLESLEAHLINLALARTGIIDYRFQLDKTRQAFYMNEQNALETMVEEAVLKIRRIRGF